MTPGFAVRTASAVVLLAAANGCANTRHQAEGEVVATYNRCLSALKEAALDRYLDCLSTPARASLQRQYDEEAQIAPLDREAWMRGLADASPYRTRILRVELSEDLNRATLETLHRSGVVEEPVDHQERIVLIREGGRWVIDKDCCEYSNARFAGPAAEGPPGTAALPQ